MNFPLPYLIIALLAFFLMILLIILIFLLASRKNSNFSEFSQKLSSLESSALHLQEISREITSLRTILHAPKLRGNFGEYLLYNLLKDCLPPKNYSEQFSFSDGSTVDAIIRLGKRIIPVDSKFPLESLERYLQSNEADSQKKAMTDFYSSVKKRIDEIAKKYIRPQEGTFDFAFMYLPSESVYYEILTNTKMKCHELFEYAMKNKVIIVSPNTFYAYLLSIVYGLKGMKIDEQAENIVRKITGIQHDFKDFTNELTVLGRHITNANGKFKEINEKAIKVENQLDGLSD
ncbi:MAG: DNA recombination protein RmuC [Treponema sp.]|nr:DNA recombination protein RmuC [Treponema sp.]